MDRRTFLVRTGAAGAAAALGSAALPGEAAATPADPAPRPVEAPWIGQQTYDVAVVGAGAFGGWTALHLQELGADVVVIDKYGPANSKATSGGETRGVRTSYGDRPHGELWTRWAYRAVDRWRRFDEENAGSLLPRVFFVTGDVILREETEPFLEETQQHWDTVGVPYEVIDGAEVQKRWPVYETADDIGIALYEPGAGVVRARRAMEAVATLFKSRGGRIVVAEARPGGRILAEDGGTDRMWDLRLTPGDAVRAEQFVFALGPWFPKAFPEIMGPRIRIPLGHVFYFGTPPGDTRFNWPNLPSYNVPGVTGWPALPPDNRGFRLRTGGHRHDDPDTSPRWFDPEESERPRDVLRSLVPALADAPVVETRSCHYESSVSRNFIIDRHPDYSNVWLAGGGSAEAFKFGPVNGEYIARRVLGVEDDPWLAEQFALPEVDEGDPG